MPEKYTTDSILEQNEREPPIDGLPDKATFRVSEVAEYYGVSERSVYLWIEHGHLKIIMTPGGQKRITKTAIDECRFFKKPTEI